MQLGALFNTDRLDAAQFLAYARRLDELGYESLWLPELFTRDPFAAAGVLLAGTERIRLATGIANVYARDPTAMVSAAATLQELSDGRFMLGLGVSNPQLNEARGHVWRPPVDKLTDYLAAMSRVRLSSPQPEFEVHVAAHGPRMLEATARAADGANTYLMPLSHVVAARQILGDGKDLNTMLFCMHEDDPARARAIIRKAISMYVGLDYYHRAWRAHGFEDDDFVEGGSDRLIDAVVAWGSETAIRDRLTAQFDRGATRVVVIPLAAGGGGQPDWSLLEMLAP